MSDEIEKKGDATIGNLTCDVLVADYARNKHPGKRSARIVETAPREYELYDVDADAVKSIADGLGSGDFGIKGHAMRRPTPETVANWLESKSAEGDGEARRLLGMSGGGHKRLGAGAKRSGRNRKA